MIMILSLLYFYQKVDFSSILMSTIKLKVILLLLANCMNTKKYPGQVSKDINYYVHFFLIADHKTDSFFCSFERNEMLLRSELL
jgi:hypothetical protein